MGNIWRCANAGCVWNRDLHCDAEDVEIDWTGECKTKDEDVDQTALF